MAIAERKLYWRAAIWAIVVVIPAFYWGNHAYLTVPDYPPRDDSIVVKLSGLLASVVVLPGLLLTVVHKVILRSGAREWNPYSLIILFYSFLFWFFALLTFFNWRTRRKAEKI